MKESVKREVEEIMRSMHEKRGTKAYSFVEEFIENISWSYVFFCNKNKLSEDFIREFKDKIDWSLIGYSQDLSEDFIYDFKDRLHLPYLIKRNVITEHRLKELEYINKIHSRFEILDL